MPILRLLGVMGVLLLSAAPALAKSLVIEPGFQQVDLAGKIQLLEDVSAEYSLADILVGRHQQSFVDTTPANLKQGFSSSAFWIKLAIDDRDPKQHLWRLVLAFPNIHFVDVYLPDVEYRGIGIQYRHISTGNRRSYSQRDVKNSHFVFHINTDPPYQQQVIYLRIFSEAASIMDMKLYSLSEYEIWSYREAISSGFMYGALIIMLMFNGVLGLALKDKSYWFYTGFLLCCVTGYAFYDGYFQQHIYADFVWAKIVIFSFALGFIFLGILANSLLDMPDAPRWMFYANNICLVNSLLVALAGLFVPYRDIVIWFMVIMSIYLFILPVLGLCRWYQGFKPARTFSLSWLCFSIGMLPTPMSRFFLLDWSSVEILVRLAILSQMALLSLALVDTINTTRRQKQQALQQAMENMQSADALKDQFLAALSHELRTPMNAIVGSLQLAKQKVDTLPEPLDIAEIGAHDMMRLVNDILTYTELQSGKTNLQLKAFNIHQLLGHLQQRYAHQAQDKGLQLEWHIMDSMPMWLLVDKGKLTILFAKLLDNAIKFCNHGRVSMQANYHDQRLVVQISDTGIGINDEKKQQIFESFTQHEGGFDRSYSGLGVGLNIANDLVNLMGGVLDCQSVLGEGSCFTFSLPLAVVEAPTPIVSLEAVDSGHLPILVVEDNLVNQKIMVKMLEQLGYQSVLANDGQEALDTLNKQPVALILMDLQMPVMDGFSCTRTIRAQASEFQQLPIIAVTANLMDADKQQCVSSGMNDFLAKPVSLGLLKKTLANYLIQDTVKS